MSVEFDVAIIGGGVAGLSAALSCARYGRRVLVLTGTIPGGQLVSIEKVEGLPGFPEGVPGFDLCPMIQEQAELAGAEFAMTICDSLRRDSEGWRLDSGDGYFSARAVILATGADLARLGVPGEERLADKGVSHCASCDAPLLRGKVAIVAGGGDSALQEALVLAEHAARVVIATRDSDFTGQAAYRQQARGHARIEPRFRTVVTEILGEDGVTGVRVRNETTGLAGEIEAHAVFAYIGLTPNSALARDLATLDASGRVVVDACMRSTAPGLCAAGNVRAGSPHRAAGGMGDGATAAAAVERYLGEAVWRDAN